MSGFCRMNERPVGETEGRPEAKRSRGPHALCPVPAPDSPQPQELPPGADLTPGPPGAGRMQNGTRSERGRGMIAPIDSIHHRVPSSPQAPSKGLTRALQERKVLTLRPPKETPPNPHPPHSPSKTSPKASARREVFSGGHIENGQKQSHLPAIVTMESSSALIRAESNLAR